MNEQTCWEHMKHCVVTKQCIKGPVNRETSTFHLSPLLLKRKKRILQTYFWSSRSCLKSGAPHTHLKAGNVSNISEIYRNVLYICVQSPSYLAGLHGGSRVWVGGAGMISLITPCPHTACLTRTHARRTHTSRALLHGGLWSGLS